MNHLGLNVLNVDLAYDMAQSQARCVAAGGELNALFGCAEQDFIDGTRRLEDFLHEDDRPLADALLDGAGPNAGMTLIRVIRPTDGKVNIVQCHRTVSAPNRLTLNLSFSSGRGDDQIEPSSLMHYMALLDNSGDYIYFKNDHCVFTGASQSVVKITRAEQHWSELIGKNDYDVVNKEHADMYFQLERQVLSGEVDHVRAIQPFMDASGKQGWVDNRKYPIKDQQGVITGLFGVARDITRLVETENALLASQAQYRNIYQNAPVGFFESSKQGRLLSCNPALAEILGYADPDEAIAAITDMSRQVYVQPSARVRLLEAAARSDGWVSLDTVEWKRRDGGMVYVELFGRWVPGTESVEGHLECAARDLTSRVQAKEALKHLTHLYASLSKCNEAIVRCRSEQELFVSVCQSAVEIAGFCMAWIGLRSEDAQTVRAVASAGENRAYLQHVEISLSGDDPGSMGPTGTAFRENRAVWCQDFLHDPMTEQWWQQGRTFGWKSSAALPLLRSGEVVATLNLYSDGVQAFGAAEQHLLLEMATDISYALERFEEARRMQHYDRELRESQELNRVANSLAKIGAWAVELPTMKLFWSEEVRAIHGLTAGEEVTLERALGFYHGKHRRLVRKAVDKCIADGTAYELDVMIVNEAGDKVWTRITGQGARDENGRLTAIHGAMQDITRVKENEATLRKLSQAVEQSPSSILITDVAARIEYVNETFLRQTGYSAQEVLGHNPRFLKSGKTLPNDYREMWAALKSGQTWRGEFYNSRKDGSEYIVSLIISPVRNDEGEVVNYLAIEDDITEKKRVEAQVSYLAHYDQLTGLPNRVLLEDHFQFAINLAARNDEKLAVMFLDLDNFKNINDGLGHAIGDQLLVQVSQRLRKMLRQEDVVARFGGDEFIMILPRTDATGASILAQKLLDNISQSFEIGPYKLSCTPSIGIAIYPDDGVEVGTLSKNADAAMYRVKQFSKNGFMFFTPEMQARSKRNLELSLAMRGAIEGGELYLKYQPQVSLDTFEMIGVEALLRWRHAEFGEVSPAEFIPIAEETGLINEIGRWVLEQAIADLKRLTAQLSDSFQMAVNLSVVQFRNRHLAEEIKSLIEQYRIPPAALTLELTEAVAMSEPEVAIAIMDELHKLGIRIAIDDFGTGYSSLSYIKRLRLHKLKIDKSFIDDIESDADDRAIAAAIINMAKSLDLQTIAEGVESRAQLNWLLRNGCDQVQGYYFSPPIDIEALLAHDKVFK